MNKNHLYTTLVDIIYTSIVENILLIYNVSIHVIKSSDVYRFTSILLFIEDTASDGCSHGDLRLSSRSDDESQLSSEGRLEVCVNSVWGTVCDTDFSSHDAQVACDQLGYEEQGISPLLFSSVFLI